MQGLRRWPEVERAGLEATDAADRLLLEEAGPALSEPEGADGAVSVVGDRYGALTLPLVASGLRVRIHQDSITSEQALLANAERLHLDTTLISHHRLDHDLLKGARLVLLRLPRSLVALAAVARAVSDHADPKVLLLAGDRLKHMNRSMNDTLLEAFDVVAASLARQKSRVLRASGPRPGPAVTPQRSVLADLGLEVVAHPGVFAGAGLDLGTRALLEHLPLAARGARQAVDLGCGSGLIAAALAKDRPDLQVIATDASTAAVASARDTAVANGLAERIEVRRADGLAGLEPDSADLIVCNPPFHSGNAVLAEEGLRILRGTRQVLRPGGELWTVFNSHLGRAKDLRRRIGPTRVVADDGRFTITCTTIS